MDSGLQKRVVLAYQKFDKLERLRSLVEDSEGTSPKAIVASAALLGAELIAYASSKENDSSLIHRMYEEIITSMESSPSVGEAFSSVRTADVRSQERRAEVQQVITDLRMDIVAGSSEDDSE